MSKRLAIVMSIIVLVVAGCGGQFAPRATVSLPPTSVPPTRAPYPTPQSPDYWPTGDWRTSTPEEQGLDPARLAEAFEQIAANHSNVHSVLVIRHGYLVVEAYFRGYTAQRTHELWSCTKSFMSTLIGIALAENAAGRAGGQGITGLDEPIEDFFPGQITPRSDRRKQAITLEHLLTMRSGLSWPESQYNADSPQSPIYKMVRTRDWPAYVLSQPMTGEPGAAFNYSSGNAHVLSAILQKATGEQTKAYAMPRLFGPLGIEDPAWSVDAAGNNIGGWGLQLTARDMARFGFLYLHGGAWDGQQIVPAGWVERATAPHLQVDERRWYGYQWWIYPFGAYAAEGMGGQYIFVAPGQDMVVVFTADLGADAGTLAPGLMASYILPAASPGRLPAGAEATARLQRAIEAAGQDAH